MSMYLSFQMTAALLRFDCNRLAIAKVILELHIVLQQTKCSLGIPFLDF